jgi:hypothetical protein
MCRYELAGAGRLGRLRQKAELRLAMAKQQKNKSVLTYTTLVPLRGDDKVVTLRTHALEVQCGC